MKIAYGINIQGDDDPYLRLVEKASAAIDIGATEVSAIDIFPFS